MSCWGTHLWVAGFLFCFPLLLKILSFRKVKGCNKNTAFTDVKCFNLPLNTQNCKEIVNPPEIQKDAEFEDEGYYTCVHSVHHNGKQYNITKTYNITVVEGKRKFLEGVNVYKESRLFLSL